MKKKIISIIIVILLILVGVGIFLYLKTDMFALLNIYPNIKEKILI